MSDRHASRSLLLERLESRCLLAAGFFASSDGHDEPGHDRRPQPRADALDRSGRQAEVRLQQQPAHRQPPHQHDPGHHEQRRGPARIDPPRPDQPIAAARRISPAQAPGVQTLSLSVTDRNGPSSSQSQSQSGVPSSEPIHSPINSPSDARGVDAREILPSRQNRNDTGSTEDVILVGTGDGDDRANETPSSVATASKQDASTVRSVDQRQSLSQSPADVQDQSETNIGGVIESIALRNSKSWNRQLPRTPRESAEDQPWQIDRETLQELREINRYPVHSQPGIADQARLDWFSGPGGLIELESDGGALPIVDVAGMIVDIPLDVIFGSHRSLDLVAVANASTGETAIRDAILAAIAGEQSDHAVPLNETAKKSLHPIAYSSVALIASTLVLASRRRQRNVLFKTRGGKQ